MEKLILQEGESATLAEYSEIDAAIAELKERYASRVYDVTTAGGMRDARAARAEVKTQRTSLEKIRVAIKKPALDKCRLIDSEAKRITTALLEIEKPIDALIKAEDKKKADEKERQERIERERLDRLEAELESLRFRLSQYHQAEDIQAFIDMIDALDVELLFGDHAVTAGEIIDKSLAEALAALVKSEGRAIVEAAHKAEQEAEAKRLAAERVELDAEREEKEKYAAHLAEAQKRIDAENSELEKEKAKVVAKRLADEEAELVKEAKLDQLAGDKAAWQKLLNDSACAGPFDALVQIHLLATGVETADKAEALVRIAAICCANTKEEIARRAQ